MADALFNHLSNEMGITFKSHEFDRILTIEDIHELSLVDARKFHVELVMAISSIDEAIARAERADASFDDDWMHKMRKKRRISQAFVAEVNRRLSSLEISFEALRQKKLRELLAQEFLPGVLEGIEEEAREAAEEEWQRFVTSHGHSAS